MPRVQPVLSAGRQRSAHDDPRVVAALEEYLRLCEAGEKPDIDAFAAARPEIETVLKQCLAGLAFVQYTVPDVERSSAGVQAAAAELLVHEPLGDFRILREIGRGGMGIVYEAEQLSLGRRVALKILPFAAVLDPRHLQRFKNEALAAARLDHPNIVESTASAASAASTSTPCDYIEGQTLAAVIDAMKGERLTRTKPIGDSRRSSAGGSNGTRRARTGSARRRRAGS